MFFNIDDERYQENPEEMLDDVIKLSLSIPTKEYINVTPPKRSNYLQDEIMRLVDYDKQNAVFKVPGYDERLVERYQRAIFDDSIDRDILPMRGYFNYISFSKTEELFGLLLHKFRYDHVNLKEGDERWFNHDRQWEKKEALMWDFEANEFIDVPTEVNKSHANSVAFLDRKKLINDILSRFEEIAEQYQDDLISFMGLKKPDVMAGEYKKYIKGYKAFLTGKIQIGLKLYFAYSSITMDEYLAVLSKVSNLLEICKIMEQNVNVLDDDYNLTNNEQLFENTKKLRTELEMFRAKRKDASTIDLIEKEWRQGYVGFDYSKMVMYPNIVEIERRRSRKGKAASKDNEIFIQRRYLNFLKKAGVAEPKLQKKPIEISSEELEEVLQLPKNLWNKEIVKLQSKYKWSIDALLKEIQSVHEYAAKHLE